jgi:hypothetical protein
MRSTPLDREKREQRQVLPGTEANRLAARAAKLRIAQAAQEVAWWHAYLYDGTVN